MATISRRRSAPADLDPKDGTGANYDEAEAPRRGSRRSSGREAVSSGSRRSAVVEDERPERGSRRSAAREEAPARSTRRSSGGGGWSTYEAKRTEGGGGGKFADEFKVSNHVDKDVIVKILDEGPYEVYLQHWLDQLPKKVRQSYVCLQTFEESCPLCELGESASSVALFNLLDLSKPNKPKVITWRASTAVADQIKRLSESPRSSPLDREDLYFVVAVTKKGQKISTVISPLDADKLAEYYDIEPFTTEELAEYDDDKHDDIESVISIDTEETLLELIDEHRL